MLIDIQTASPPFKILQSKAAEELKSRMAGRPAVARMIDSAANHSSIESRYVVVPDADDSTEKKFYSDNGVYYVPDTKTRMTEYEKWSKELTKIAVGKLFGKNNLNPMQISNLITISCTGFFAPGLDYYLINEFKIKSVVKRMNIGFMGCAASVVGFNSVLDILNSGTINKKNVLLVSVELCSLHLQTEPTRDNILANMIFADGCAAALFSNDEHEKSKPNLKIISADSVLFENSEKYMGWKIGNSGFEMMLSSDLPRIITDEAVPALKNILAKKNIPLSTIKYWALHPGGRAILDSLQTGLCLSDDQLKPSRNILKNYGNMSSASILFVLKEIIGKENILKGDYCCVVAFGPGLTMEVALMKGE